MKTSIVQNKIKVAAAVVACLTFIQSAAFAGGSSGNGNGDSAFALQDIGKAKAGSSVQEFLIHAFGESKHRVPEIHYKQNEKSEDGYNYLRGSFFKEFHDGAVEYKIVGSAEQLLPKPLGATFIYTKQVNTGPLASSTSEELSLISNASIYPMSKAETGLLATFRSDVPNLIEFRRYTPNIVIFVTRPYSGSGEFKCGTLAGSFRNNVTSYVKFNEKNERNEFCSVGYFWIN